MMNNDMLANIEYLREKADVSYEEAMALLEQNDGNVMRVLVALEHQGRVYSQPQGETRESRQRYDYRECEGMKKTRSFVSKAMKARLIVEKKDGDDAQHTVANVPVPFAAAFAVAAPWLTVATAGIICVTGHNVRFDRAADEQPKEDA